MAMFSATINGVQYDFRCWSSDTRNGFCHKCYDYTLGKTSMVSYLNRTWERFEFETVLRRAIEKHPKKNRQALTDILIDHKAQEVHEQCERDVQRFKELHDGLTDRQKEVLAQTPPMQSEEDMHRMMGIMGVMNLFNQLGATK